MTGTGAALNINDAHASLNGFRAAFMSPDGKFPIQANASAKRVGAVRAVDERRVNEGCMVAETGSAESTVGQGTPRVL